MVKHLIVAQETLVRFQVLPNRQYARVWLRGLFTKQLRFSRQGSNPCVVAYFLSSEYNSVGRVFDCNSLVIKMSLDQNRVLGFFVPVA